MYDFNMVRRLLSKCYENVTRLLQECYKTVINLHKHEVFYSYRLNLWGPPHDFCCYCVKTRGFLPG